MAEITLDKSTTALLMADFSAGNMAQNPIVHERQTFERAGAVLAAARQAGIFVTYCISHFRPGYPEIPAQHNPRSPMRATGAVLPADPALLIHPSVAPLTITHIDCLSVWPRASPRPATSSHAGHATRSARQASRPSDD